MSPISADDLHRIFKKLDKKNKGVVGIEELQHLLEQIGIQTRAEELEKLVGATAGLNYLDFFFFYEANVKAEHDDDLLKAFEVFDLNGDGRISCDELHSVLSRLGLLEKRSADDCKEMISVYDANSDGVLDFHEFKDMMSAPTSHQQHT
ncbi:probable calcium-binding protein CML44 [Salvia miltiorrhiza]|uniref:probable calcium-binding protein CML44 n=1 Tax=Salvia miltiorrhiza TaxID=226208 RepID=UPI0025AC88F4|nr:probable calcium-binding protein CML44 [Salvia miltiorrhiza]